MKIKRDQITYFFICTYFAIQAIFFKFNIYFSYFANNILIINLVTLFLIFALNYRIVVKDRRKIIFLIINLLMLIISAIINSSSFGGILNTVTFLLGLTIFSKVKVNFKKNNKIIFIFLIILVIMILNSKNVWEEHIKGTARLNPNTIALIIFFTYFIIKSILSNFNIKAGKIFIFLLILISSYGIYKCECRTVLVTILTCTLIDIIPVSKKKINKNTIQILIATTVIGLVIPILYVNMYNKGISFKIPLLTKSLYTGREYLWKAMIDSMSTDKIAYIIGVGTNNITRIGIIENYHNWFLGYLYTYGAVNFITYFGYIIYTFKNVNKTELKCALLGIFFIGIFESTGLWAFIHFYIFFLLASDNSNCEKESEKDGNNNFYTDL